MSIRLGLVVGLLVAIGVTYLASINPGRAHLVLGDGWSVDDILDMEHEERHVWLREIARVNREINEARRR